MKKTTLLAVAVLAISVLSCKKDRTCTCTYQTISITSTQPGFTYTPGPANTSSTKYTKIKKKDINAQYCVTSENTNSYTQTVYTGSTTAQYVVTEVSKNTCELK